MSLRIRCDVQNGAAHVLFTLCVLVITLPYAQAACEPGLFGTNCTEVCHCLNGASVCDTDNGACGDFMCAKGWKSGPTCQIPCDLNKEYGVNCQYQCHCPYNDTCSPINGLCASGRCHEEWTGGGCQTRLPKLVSPPIILNVTCTALNITWPSWRESFDVGSPPIHSYNIQNKVNNSSWRWVQNVLHDSSTETYNVLVEGLLRYAIYQYRVVTNRDTFGTLQPGFPGPLSEKVSPVCIDPTTTTIATTAMTSTSTSAAMTSSTSTPSQTTENPETTETITTVASTPAPQAPGPVLNLTAIILSDGDIRLNWRKPKSTVSSEVSAYVMTVNGTGNCPSSTNSYSLFRLGASETTFFLTNLSKWSKYSIFIRAENDAGLGNQVETRISTPETEPTGIVTNITHEELKQRSINFHWTKLPCSERGGTIIFYVVEISISQLSNSTSYVYNRTAVGTKYTLNDVTPFTNITVKVSAVNNAGRSEFSAPYSVQTSEEIPGFPIDVRVDQSDSELYVTWGHPLQPNGIILQYEVLYKMKGAVETRVIIQDAGLGRNRTISGLKPATTYSVQVKARNAAGWGEASTPIEVSTDEGVPSQPRRVRLTARAENCLTVEWQPPEFPNGVIRNYVLNYEQRSSYSGDIISPGSASVSGDVLAYQKCGLLAGIRYSITVSARNGMRDSVGVSLLAETEIMTPPKPEAPSVANVTHHSITLLLKSVVHRNGPISSYYVMINKDSQSRRKRETENEILQSKTRLRGYIITAKFLPQEINRPTELYFTIGDGKKYNGYTNSPLEENSLYNITYVVSSSLGNVTKVSWSHVFSKKTTTTSTVPPPSDINIPLIIGLCVCIFVLILLVILIVIFLLMRRNRRDSMDLKPTWLEYYKNNFTQEMPHRTSGWSDIYQLNEPRFVKIVDPDVIIDDPPVSVNGGKQSPISFEQEFLQLPHGQKYPWKTAQRPENAAKNRFDHLLAYDHSRVVLRKTPIGVSDYINANYVNGYKTQAAYIAAQSPFNDLTINDFWQMIFQENVAQIILIANPVEDGILKCEPYWPDGGYLNYRSIRVELTKELKYANFTVRMFEVTDESENVTHTVVQYHFTAWPEHGVPDDPIPFLEFRNKVDREMREGQGPMLVHCGTGVSRTAVFIAVDSLLQQAKTEGLVNVYRFSKRMRRNRTFMIRTLKQYIFLYDTLFEALQTSHNNVGENNLKANYRLLANVNPVSQKSYFREQFEVMERLTPDLNREKCLSGTLDINSQKNRFSTLLPPDNYRPRIRSMDIHTDYVNAVFLDSYTQSNAFILTQTPLQSTIADFWSLVYDHDVYTIVMMNDDTFREDTCVKYWPSQADGGTLKFHPFMVEMLSIATNSNLTIREMTLTNVMSLDEQPRRIKQFQLNGWRMYDKLPPSRIAIFEIIERVEQWKESIDFNDSSVLVHCMDGASRSGLFTAVRVLCEKLVIDGEVDVYHTIKHMKKRRPLIVCRVEQYKFCFKALWDFMHNRESSAKTIPNGTANGRLSNRYSGSRLSFSSLYE